MSKFGVFKELNIFRNRIMLRKILKVSSCNRSMSNQNSQINKHQENSHFFGFEAVSPEEKRDKGFILFKHSF